MFFTALNSILRDTREMDNLEEIRNATYDYLLKHYPQSLGIIPEQVFEFGLPSRSSALIFGLFNAVFLIFSLTGNIIMFYLYTKVNLVSEFLSLNKCGQ